MCILTHSHLPLEKSKKLALNLQLQHLITAGLHIYPQGTVTLQHRQWTNGNRLFGTTKYSFRAEDFQTNIHGPSPLLNYNSPTSQGNNSPTQQEPDQYIIITNHF